MTDLTTLRDLKQRVENATGPDEALDVAICVALQYGSDEYKNATNFRVDPHDINWLLFEAGGEERRGQPPAITASIDASFALVERVLPGFSVNTVGVNPHLNRRSDAELVPYSDEALVLGPRWGEGATIPRAVLSALFSALIAKEDARMKEGAET
jgi:hypothetical protein